MRTKTFKIGRWELFLEFSAMSIHRPLVRLSRREGWLTIGWGAHGPDPVWSVDITWKPPPYEVTLARIREKVDAYLSSAPTSVIDTCVCEHQAGQHELFRSSLLGIEAEEYGACDECDCDHFEHEGA